MSILDNVGMSEKLQAALVEASGFAIAKLGSKIKMRIKTNREYSQR